jgi:hypothetical protein
MLKLPTFGLWSKVEVKDNLAKIVQGFVLKLGNVSLSIWCEKSSIDSKCHYYNDNKSV